MENFEKTMREKGKCCITEKPLKNSRHLNFIQLHIKASWEFPIWGNFITGESNIACAYVHDDAIVDGKLSGPVKYMVQFEGNDIIYHEIPRCRVCGCTEDNCIQCIEKTGYPCYWVEKDLCSACQSTSG